jgi:hypothetical protein
VHFHKCSWLGLKIVHNFLLKICIYKNPSNASINLYALCTLQNIGGEGKIWVSTI